MIKLREQYGWVICVASTLLIFCTGGLAMTGFGAYQPYVIEHGGLSNTQSSTMLLCRTIFMLVGLAVVSGIIKRLEIRRTITFSLILCAAAFLVYAFADSFIMYCVGASIAGLAFGCGGMIPASVLIMRWFEEHRGLALGLCMAATGMSSIVASPYIAYMVSHHSLRVSFLAEAVFILVVAAIVWIVVRSMPECLNTKPIGEHHLHDVRKYAPAEAPAPLFIGMFLGILIFGMSSNNYHPHISVLYNSCGYDPEEVAALVSIFGMTLAFGKCAYGFIVDMIGAFRASLILYVFAGVGLGLSCLADNGNLTMAYIAVGLSGIGLAVVTVSISVYASGVSTEEHYARSVSRFQLASHIGSLAFGVVPGMMADRMGSYIPSFVLMFAFAVISGLMLSVFYFLIEQRNRKLG